MALIIEDGSIVAGADSFISLADARVFAINYGLTLPTDDTEAEVALRNGYLNLTQREYLLQGDRVSADQTGIYPRSNVLKHCFNVASDSIPENVKTAQVYAADAINGGASMNSIDTGENLSGFSVDGVYSETYQDGSSASTNPSIQGVYNSLYPLTKAGLAASSCGGGLNGLSRTNMGYL